MAYRPTKARSWDGPGQGDGAHGGWLSPTVGPHEGDFTEMEVKEPAEPTAEAFAEAQRTRQWPGPRGVRKGPVGNVRFGKDSLSL